MSSRPSSGSIIVYTHITAAAQNIFRFDTANPANQPVELDPTSNAVRKTPAIGGDTVAWEDLTYNPSISQVVAYNLTTHVATRITNTVYNEEDPAVSPDGHVIVWTECTTNAASGCSIYQSTFSGGTWSPPKQLTNPALGDAGRPHTDGSLVVYDSTRSGQQGVYWQAVGGGPESQLVDPGSDRNAHVSGDLITFDHQDAATDQQNIFGYDPANDTLYQITNDSNLDTLNDVSVDSSGQARVAWNEYTQGHWSALAATFVVPTATIQTFGPGSHAVQLVPGSTVTATISGAGGQAGDNGSVAAAGGLGAEISTTFVASGSYVVNAGSSGANGGAPDGGHGDVQYPDFFGGHGGGSSSLSTSGGTLVAIAGGGGGGEGLGPQGTGGNGGGNVDRSGGAGEQCISGGCGTGGGGGGGGTQSSGGASGSAAISDTGQPGQPGGAGGPASGGTGGSTVGGGGGGGYQGGAVGEVAAFDHALTAAQLEDEYRTALGTE
jgi:WD40-like Beta Propeller Repeat